MVRPLVEPELTQDTRWQGDWNVGTVYEVGDAVHFGGRGFIAVAPSTGVVPPATATSSAFWSIFADKGEQGDQGPRGFTGEKGDPGDPFSGVLNDMTDVTLAGLAARHVLIYDSDTSQWVNRLLVAADLPAHNHNDTYYTKSEVDSLTSAAASDFLGTAKWGTD